MKKYLIIITVFIASMLGFIGNAHALTYARVTNASAVLRTGPGINHSKASTLYMNDVIPLVSIDTFKSQKACPTGWYKANINGKIEYICAGDISKMSTTIRVDGSKTKYLAIRNGAGTTYSTYSTVPWDKIFTLQQDKKVSGAGCPGGWYRVNYEFSDSRYVCSDYVTDFNTKSNIIVSNTNTATLRTSPSNTSKIVDHVKYGQAISLYRTTKHAGKGCPGGWYRVFYKNSMPYACSDDVVATYQVGSVTEQGGVNIRKSASSSSARIATLNYMQEVIMDSTTKYNGSGCADGWYKISYNWGTAYVCSTYVTMSRTGGKVTANSDVKATANSSSKTIATISKNKLIWLEGTNKHTGSGCKAGWYKVSIDGQYGYICSDRVEYGNNSTTTTSSSTNTNTSTSTNTNTNVSKATRGYKTSAGYYYSINKITYRVKEDYAYVRSSATTNSSHQDTLYLGAEVDVIGTSSGSGCSAGWYKIKYYNNYNVGTYKTGYICKSLVDKYEDVTKNDSSYCNTLKNAGFPESYCPYLSYLHSKHPNWVFKAEKTNVNFNDAVAGEANKNYTQATHNTLIASSAIREAGGWRTASVGYTAFMLDPRSYLNEQNIFAFEHLGYDSAFHTTSAIRSIVSGTYLDNNTYANYFLNAGKTYKISPVHLASRVKQEGGSNSNYAAVSGNVNSSCTVTAYVCASYIKLNGNKGTITDSEVNLRDGAGTNHDVKTQSKKGESFTLASSSKYSGSGCSSGWYKVNITRSLKGIYNYYNIGAYGSNPVMRGLEAAAGCVDYNDGTPWDSREKAIKYGAAFIANGYIGKGQDTMYYQKFNTSPNSKYNRYTHQYMTNILAPASESLSTYNSYNKLGLINKGYVFKIPVYNSMPNELTTQPPV